MADTFSPFDKSQADLDGADLAKLRSVAEGWHIEYKRDLVSLPKLAKSISSFANTYGGWLFVGVKEKSKDDPVAGSFPGISVRDLDSAMQRVRQAAGLHLSHAPHFDTKVIKGPCHAVGLLEDTAVIAICVPPSNTAPHVHKDARIYTRVGDSSEPRPETDALLISQLSERANETRRSVSEWVNTDPRFSAMEERTPFIRFLFTLDPWQQSNPTLNASIPEVREVLAKPDDASSIFFDVVYPAPGGLVARQVMGNNPLQLGLTCRLRWGLACDLLVPVPMRRAGTTDALRDTLRGYNNVDAFVDALVRQGFVDPYVADLNFVLAILIAFIAKYRRLTALAGVHGPSVHFKARALNLQFVAPGGAGMGSDGMSDLVRTVPFIDISTIIDDFREHGVPVPMDRIAMVPAGDTPESFLELVPDASGNDVDAIVLQASHAFAAVGPLFGFAVFDGSARQSRGEGAQVDERMTSILRDAARVSHRAQLVQSRLQPDAKRGE